MPSLPWLPDLHLRESRAIVFGIPVATRKPISRSGRFKTGPSEEVRAYSESISFDWRLYRQDIAGSIAHATMLAKVGILTRRERDQIIAGLKQSVYTDIEGSPRTPGSHFDLGAYVYASDSAPNPPTGLTATVQ